MPVNIATASRHHDSAARCFCHLRLVSNTVIPSNSRPKPRITVKAKIKAKDLDCKAKGKD